MRKPSPLSAGHITRRGVSSLCVTLLPALLVVGVAARWDGTSRQKSNDGAAVVSSADSPGRESPRTSSSPATEVEEALASKVPCPAAPAPARHSITPRRASATAASDLSFDAAPSLQTIGTRIQV